MTLTPKSRVVTCLELGIHWFPCFLIFSLAPNGNASYQLSCSWIGERVRGVPIGKIKWGGHGFKPCAAARYDLFPCSSKQFRNLWWHARKTKYPGAKAGVLHKKGMFIFN